MSDVKVSGNGIGFGSLLAIVFIVLKLCKVIAWSWFWVLAPIWIPVAIILGALLLIFVTVVAAKK
jgi:hypothetical protein